MAQVGLSRAAVTRKLVRWAWRRVREWHRKRPWRRESGERGLGLWAAGTGQAAAHPGSAWRSSKALSCAPGDLVRRSGARIDEQARECVAFLYRHQNPVRFASHDYSREELFLWFSRSRPGSPRRDPRRRPRARGARVLREETAEARKAA